MRYVPVTPGTAKMFDISLVTLANCRESVRDPRFTCGGPRVRGGLKSATPANSGNCCIFYNTAFVRVFLILRILESYFTRRAAVEFVFYNNLTHIPSTSGVFVDFKSRFFSLHSHFSGGRKI